MATATVTTINNDEYVWVPEKTVVVPGKYEWKRNPETKTYTLNLSEDEARTLVGVTRKISGIGGRRAHTDSIQHALADLGVPNARLPELSGQLNFPTGDLAHDRLVGICR